MSEIVARTEVVVYTRVAHADGFLTEMVHGSQAACAFAKCSSLQPNARVTSSDITTYWVPVALPRLCLRREVIMMPRLLRTNLKWREWTSNVEHRSIFPRYGHIP
jgi:hypothetical protein